MSVQLYGWSKPLSFEEISLKKRMKVIKPMLSVVIPTLNQGKTLEHTLLTILNQDYLDFEIIIIDGGSTDDTSKIIDKYRDWVSYVESGKDNGQSEAINKGFMKASGNVYAWINSDDYYLPGAFHQVVKKFDEDDNIDVVVGGGSIVTSDSQFLKHIDGMEMIRENLLQWHKDKWIMQQSCFWKSGIWKKCGGVDLNLRLLMDFDLWLRFSDVGKSAVTDQDLAVMRYYPEAKSVSLKSIVREEEAYVYAKNRELDEVMRVVREIMEESNSLKNLIKRHEERMVYRVFRRFGIYK